MKPQQLAKINRPCGLGPLLGDGGVEAETAILMLEPPLRIAFPVAPSSLFKVPTLDETGPRQRRQPWIHRMDGSARLTRANVLGRPPGQFR